MKTFAQLFKKYRLRAEFETFSAFGNALAEKGYFYEDSIFSHWQKGTRVPQKREVILAIVTIFIEHDAIHTVDEANELLASVGLVYITDKERAALQFGTTNNPPFQVPNEIAYFTGRKSVLGKVSREILSGKIVLLYGSPGVGKTSLAIKLGHLLRDKFPDGVLWYKVDSTNVMDILLSIANLYGEDISAIKNIEVRSSIVRTLLQKKKVLLIFDNVASVDKLHLLLPNTSSSGVIFTSRENTLHFAHKSIAVHVDSFTEKEVLTLFQKVFSKEYSKTNYKLIVNIAQRVGNLPLAVNIAANHMKEFQLSPEKYMLTLEDQRLNLNTFKYEDKNLSQAVAIGFNSLDIHAKKVFSSLGVFEGKDFSLESVASINKLSASKTEDILQQLMEISFIEKSKVGRYRIHPLLKLFARENLNDSSVYLQAAKYYEQQLVLAQENKSYKSLMQDTENIVFIFKKCYDFGYWDQIITLWNPIEKFLKDTNEVKKLRLLMETVDTSPRVNNLQKILTVYYCLLIIYWVLLFFSGQTYGFWNAFYSLSYTIMPLIAGIISLARSKPWGLFSSNIGKAISLIALGLFFWGIGNSIWAYYNFVLNVQAPYPSWADVGFLIGYIFWLMSAIYLSFATRAKFGAKKKGKRLVFLTSSPITMSPPIKLFAVIIIFINLMYTPQIIKSIFSIIAQRTR